MRILRPIPLVSALLSALPTAAAQNEFIIFPERNGSSSTYMSRQFNTAVEILQGVPGTLFAAVGDRTAACQARGVFGWVTDENPTTQESFHIVLRKPDSAGLPDATAAGLIMSAGPFLTPIGGPARQSWKVSTTFASPVAIPCSGGFFMGLALPDALTWPTDGLSVWDAQYNPPPARNIGDNPRAGAPGHAWVITLGNVHGPYAHVQRIGVLTDAPVLNVGGIDPANPRQSPAGSSNYGAGGMYPDIGGNPRSDGIDVRFENLTASPIATAVLLLSSGITPFAPIPSTGVEGRLWLDTRLLLITGFGTLRSGLATIQVAPPRVVSPALVGITLFFQGATIDFLRLRTAFTNVQGVSF